tara:strand:- start:287 stop:523 length:237 start_codon:yes stop_codon:yes gene_type:complete
MKYTVYSRKGCPYCEKVVQVFKLSEQTFVEYKLDKDFTRDQFYEEFGEGATFPQVISDKKYIGGCTETIAFLRENKVI